MPPVGFEPIISAGEGQQIDALDWAANGTGVLYCIAVGKWRRNAGVYGLTFELCAASYNFHSYQYQGQLRHTFWLQSPDGILRASLLK
jgi:hypothetical protein